MQSVSDDDVRKRLLEKPRFELAAKVVFKNINTDMQIAIQIYVATSRIHICTICFVVTVFCSDKIVGSDRIE